MACSTEPADGNIHGYAILAEVRVPSEGRVRLGTGALERLQDRGCVAAEGDEIVDGRVRRYHRLTDDGAGSACVGTRTTRAVVDRSTKPIGGSVLTSPLRLRLALHAFPRRFRTERVAEIEATFHEAALAGELHPYGPHALADVVTAGWRDCARSRPPFGAHVKYRMLGGRLEPRWHAWMLDDGRGLFSLRRVLWVAWPLAIALLVSSAHFPPANPSCDVMLSHLSSSSSWQRSGADVIVGGSFVRTAATRRPASGCRRNR